jgi:CMP-N-acetylneuraminic acid synthetase
MIANGPVLAIVPARGGSKGVPRKNIVSVAGRPLIEWTLAAARAATRVERVIVSTDDEEIASIARRAGTEVPFARPPELARDDTPGPAVILHAVDWLTRVERYSCAAVVTLQPTSPLRTAADIDAALSLLDDRAAHSVIGVSPSPHSPYWMMHVESDLRMRDFLPEDPPNRQDLPALCTINGAIYVTRTDRLLQTGTLYGEGTLAYVMPEERSLDVDTAWDLHLVDLILRDRIRRGLEERSMSDVKP